MDFGNYLDSKLLGDFERFLRKVNERTEKTFGLRASYDDEGDPALGDDVEYFHHCITADDRMRYIMSNIVTVPALSEKNKIGNSIISHFYGARGIHTLMSGIMDPQLAHVDFERVGAGDVAYTEHLRANAKAYHAQGQKFYGTTELHTSLQTAGRNFCRVKYNDPTRAANLLDIVEWISSWAVDGSLDHILSKVTSLNDMYTYLKTKNGIGEYYGYHCATSNSVNPILPFNHDEKFCAPGPGAKETLAELFKPLEIAFPKKKFPYEDLVIYIRENQTKLFDVSKITPHVFFHNYQVGGQNIFKDPQNELKVYGTEVACCQFSVYLRLRSNPHLISKRKIARVKDLKPLTMTSSLIEF